MSPEAIRNLVGKKARFDHNGAHLTGIIDKAEDGGLAQPGAIPDVLLSIRGASGKVLHGVSLVNSYLDLVEDFP